jgi:hypothetical protein
MNIFSTDAYLESLAEVYFPGKPKSIEEFRVEADAFRLLVVGGAPITEFAFLDFVQPLARKPSGKTRALGYLPNAVLSTTRVDGRPEDAKTESRSPSPFIDWTLFPEWPAFEKHVAAKIGNLGPDSKRKRKKLERDLGPISFVFDDKRPEVFDACIRWKSSQYVATGLTDMFARPENVTMFRTLHGRGALVVSSLSAGSTLLAVHFGGLADQRHYWWVPTYDPAYSKYSPGRLLLESILQESHRLGHLEFDFLIGDEAYKWHYATHNRAIGALGTPPISRRVKAALKRRVKGALAGHPRLMTAASALKKQLR